MTLSWDAGSNVTGYQLVIGSAPGTANILPATDVAGTSYTWTSPRTGGTYYARVAAKRGDSISPYSNELSLFVLDIRNVIDALYFDSGPMASTPAKALTNPVTSIWADGAPLSVLVSSESGDIVKSNAQTFVSQYAALTGINATVTTTADDMKGKDYRTFAEFAIGVRIQAGFCGGALGCVPIGSGPSPGGPNRSVVTLEQNTGLTTGATAHELGHAYGLSHVTIPVAGRQEFRFMMSPLYVSDQMTDVEKLAITLARQAGLRTGMTRSQALSLDLVNPYTGTSNLTGLRAPAPACAPGLICTLSR